MYTLTELATISGVEPQRLRLWKTRYDFPKALPIREHSKYTEQELIRLVNISILLTQGWRISKALSLAPDELRTRATDLSSSSMAKFRFAAVINGLIRHIFDYDQLSFVRLYQSARSRISMAEMLTEIDFPLLQRISLLWRNEKVKNMHQRFLAELLMKSYASDVYTRLLTQTSDKDAIILYSGEGTYSRLFMYFSAVYLMTRKRSLILLGESLSYREISKSDLKDRFMIGFDDAYPVDKDKIVCIDTRTRTSSLHLPLLLDQILINRFSS